MQDTSNFFMEKETREHGKKIKNSAINDGKNSLTALDLRHTNKNLWCTNTFFTLNYITDTDAEYIGYQQIFKILPQT